MRSLISGRGRFIAVTAAAASAVVVIVWGLSVLLPPAVEPSYRGKSLRWWTNRMDPGDPTSTPAMRAEAEEAVRTIGTNAIPILLSWLEHSDSWMERRVADGLKGTKLGGLKSPLGWFCETHYHYRSLLAFQVLGPTAESSVPALETLIMRNDPRISCNAALALVLVAPRDAERVSLGPNAGARRWVSDALAHLRTYSGSNQLGAANRSEPVGQQTNRASAAAGSGR